MKKRALRLCSLVLALCLALPLVGCASFPALSEFFNPTGTQTVTTVKPGTDPTRPTGTVRMYYDERLELYGSIVSLDNQVSEDELLIDVVGEDTEAGSVTLRAVGVGTADLTVLRDGYEVTLPLVVEPAPLSCFLVIGGDDALGSASAAAHPVKAQDGLVYYTVGQVNGSPVNVNNIASCIPASLASEGVYAANGTRLDAPLFALTASGEGNYAGFVSSFAYKWVEQTGERVWMINAARAGSRISDWSPSDQSSTGCYNPAVALFGAAGELLTAELATGHYTLGSIGYLFCQGESDANTLAATYTDAMEDLHAALMRDLKVETPDGKTVKSSFGGIIACRAAKVSGAAAVRMNGPRAAQHYIANSNDPAFKDLYMLANAVDYWGTDESVAAYFSRYDTRKYSSFYGYAMPTGVAALMDNGGNYTEAAYNELGAEAAENLLYITGHRQNTGTYSVSLLGTDGINEIADRLYTPYGINYFSAVPIVAPLRLAKTANVTLSFTYEGGEAVENYYLKNAPFGKLVTLSLKLGAKEVKNISTALRYDLSFPFMQSLPQVSYVDGQYRFYGYTSPWSCGYVNQSSGAFSPYTAIDKHGWLNDGKDTWGGHGGVHASKNWKYGPVNNWDSAFAFTAPEKGTLSVSYNGFVAPSNDYLYGIFVNGKMVWPTAGATPDNSTAYYTVTKNMTDKEMTELLKNFTAKVEKGDTVTFVCRRLNKQTAEGAVYPVIKYLDEPIEGEKTEEN